MGCFVPRLAGAPPLACAWRVASLSSSLDRICFCFFLTGRSGDESESENAPGLCFISIGSGDALRDWGPGAWADGPAEGERDAGVILAFPVESTDFISGRACTSSSDSVAESPSVCSFNGGLGGEGELVIGSVTRCCDWVFPISWMLETKSEMVYRRRWKDWATRWILQRPAYCRES